MNTATNFTNIMVDSWLETVKTAAAGQEMAERVVDSWLTQNQAYRAEIQKTAAQMVQVAKANQATFQKLMNATWERSVETVRKAQDLHMEEMHKQAAHWAQAGN